MAVLDVLGPCCFQSPPSEREFGDRERDSREQRKEKKRVCPVSLTVILLIVSSQLCALIVWVKCPVNIVPMQLRILLIDLLCKV